MTDSNHQKKENGRERTTTATQTELEQEGTDRPGGPQGQEQAPNPMHDAVDGAGRRNTQIQTQGSVPQMLREFLEEQSSENNQPSTRGDIKLVRVD